MTQTGVRSMKLIELKEPKLEFANGNTHICPRHGIAEYSVFDANLETRPDKIVAGVVGTDDGIRKFQGFINWTQSAVPTESSNNRLHPSFCGMSKVNGLPNSAHDRTGRTPDNSWLRDQNHKRCQEVH